MDVIKVYSSYKVDSHMIGVCPNEEIERRAYQMLIRGIAEYIGKNVDKVPAVVKKERIAELGNEEYVMSINIISDEELMRYGSIERELNDLKFNKDRG